MILFRKIHWFINFFLKSKTKINKNYKKQMILFRKINQFISIFTFSHTFFLLPSVFLQLPHHHHKRCCIC